MWGNLSTNFDIKISKRQMIYHWKYNWIMSPTFFTDINLEFLTRNYGHLKKSRCPSLNLGDRPGLNLGDRPTLFFNSRMIFRWPGRSPGFVLGDLPVYFRQKRNFITFLSSTSIRKLFGHDFNDFLRSFVAQLWN